MPLLALRRCLASGRKAAEVLVREEWRLWLSFAWTVATYRTSRRYSTPLRGGAGHPTNLVEFAKSIRSDPSQENKKTKILGLGEVSFLFRTRNVNREAFVFGMQDDSEPLNGRFAAVVLNGPNPTVKWIVPNPLLSEPQEKSNTPDSAQASPFPDPSVMPHSGVEFYVSELKMPKPARAYQITVTESEVHAVNWIVVVPTQGGFRFDAVKIASDYNELVPCAGTPHEQTALSVRRIAGTLTADIVAQSAFSDFKEIPQLLDDMDEEQRTELEKKGCPFAVRLTWRADRGFAVQRTALKCTDKTRGKFVAISPKGEIRIVDDYLNK